MSSINEEISGNYAFSLEHVEVAKDARMAYIDTDVTGVQHSNHPPLVFLHGNPTSSYVWRNIIPHVQHKARCIAPDLMGMGASQKLASERYGWHNHNQYLESFVDNVLGPKQKIILVLHDFGSLFGFHWAHHHSNRVAGLVFMEFLYDFPDWDATNTDTDFAQRLGTSLESLRQSIVNDNIFIEDFIQSQVIRTLSQEEMDHYRAPFRDVASRESMLEFAKLVPVKNASPYSHGAAEDDQAWLAQTEVPKLYFWADPGKMQPPRLSKEYSDKFHNIKSIGVGHAKHYLQEDHPHLIGEGIAQWLESQQFGNENV